MDSDLAGEISRRVSIWAGLWKTEPPCSGGGIGGLCKHGKLRAHEIPHPDLTSAAGFVLLLKECLNRTASRHGQDFQDLLTAWLLSCLSDDPLPEPEAALLLACDALREREEQR